MIEILKTLIWTVAIHHRIYGPFPFFIVVQAWDSLPILYRFHASDNGGY